jgi:hypothetical protein
MQNYSKLLVERGWRPRTTPDNPSVGPSLTNSQQGSSEGVSLGERGCCEVHDRMDSRARQFGQSHAYLFPLIGKRVVTPRGPGRLETVFAQRCEVVLDAEPGLMTCFRPEEIGLVA